MPEDQKGGGAAGNDGSANGSPSPGDQGNQNQNQGGNDRAVPLSDHKKTLDQLHATKAELQQLREEKEAREREGLEKNSEFKTLYERSQQELKGTKTKHDELKKAFQHTLKSEAVKTEAVKRGIRNVEDLELVSLDGVECDLITDSKGGFRFETKGADSFVEGLVKTREHWFKSNVPPNVNGGGGTGAKPLEKKTITITDVNEAERQYKLGKIPKAEYEGLYHAYIKQKASGG